MEKLSFLEGAEFNRHLFYRDANELRHEKSMNTPQDLAAVKGGSHD